MRRAVAIRRWPCVAPATLYAATYARRTTGCFDIGRADVLTVAVCYLITSNVEALWAI